MALPVLLVVLIEAEGPTSPLAAGIFGVVAFTDFVDGKLARALHAESRFGRIAVQRLRAEPRPRPEG